MERLTKRVGGIAVLKSWALDKDPVSIAQRLCSALATYEDTGLEPEDVKVLTSIHGLSAQEIVRICKLYQAEQDGRLVVLRDGVTIQGLQEEYRKAKYMADDQLPSPSYTTGHIAGFGAGQVSILEKILTREEAEAALSGKGGEG